MIRGGLIFPSSKPCRHLHRSGLVRRNLFLSRVRRITAGRRLKILLLQRKKEKIPLKTCFPGLSRKAIPGLPISALPQTENVPVDAAGQENKNDTEEWMILRYFCFDEKMKETNF